jgi:hypothetical protein
MPSSSASLGDIDNENNSNYMLQMIKVSYSGITEMLNNSILSGQFTKVMQEYASEVGSASLAHASAGITPSYSSLSYSINVIYVPTPSPTVQADSFPNLFAYARKIVTFILFVIFVLLSYLVLSKAYYMKALNASEEETSTSVGDVEMKLIHQSSSSASSSSSETHHNSLSYHVFSLWQRISNAFIDVIFSEKLPLIRRYAEDGEFDDDYLYGSVKSRKE